MRRRQCAFCLRNDQKITKEHAWPNWVRKWLPAPAGHIAFQRRNRPTRHWPVPRDEMGVTVNDVCKGCNDGWMRAIEETTEPILSPMIQAPLHSQLDPRQQQAIAVWAYKTAMVVDLIKPHRERFFADQERHTLAQTHAMPGNQPFIWLAGFVGFQLATAVDYSLFYDPGDRAADRPTDAYCVTVTVGHVALQVFAYHRLEEVRRVSLQVPTAWDRATVRLWPANAQPIGWPPAQMFDTHGLSLFIDRFRPRTSR